MNCLIAPVVEGHTEQQGALAVLLRRIWYEHFQHPDHLTVRKAVRGDRGGLVHQTRSTLPQKVEEAWRGLAVDLRHDPTARPLVLILIDAEDECPAELGPRLLAEARNGTPPALPVRCVVANRMFENWIVAGCSTLAGVGGLPDPLPTPPQKPDELERLRGASWLDDRLREASRGKKAKKYDKKVDAPKLVGGMDLPGCRDKSPSFRKLLRELEAHFPLPPPPPDPPPPDTPTS